MQKKSFRKSVRLALNNIDEKNFETWSVSLSVNLKSYLSNQTHIASQIIGAFYPIDWEPQWSCCFKEDELNWRFAFPHFSKEIEGMVFQRSTLGDLIFSDEFSKNRTDMKVPKLENKVVQPDLILIPGMAFSRKGDRLGRGKGFYDRYLSHFEGLKIGLGFEASVFDFIPTDDHDVKLNLLITDKNIYRFDP